MMKPITKEQAIALFGTPSELARALGIRPQAVSQWAPGERIPEKHELKIRYVLLPRMISEGESDTAA